MAVSRPSLIISRVLTFRDHSPFIVFTDTILQSAYSLLLHAENNARQAKWNVIRIGWQAESDVRTITDSPLGNKSIDLILKEIKAKCQGKTVLTIPDLNDFLSSSGAHFSSFLSTLLSYGVTLLCVFHTDIPNPGYPNHLPQPFTLLNYLATSIVKVESLEHHKLRVEAERVSKTSSVDLDLEGVDVFIPLGSNSESLFINFEHRRKSGRGVVEECTFINNQFAQIDTVTTKEKEEELDVTFRIELSDREKEVRDKLVLPHFKAQEGYQDTGHIYYEVDSGDDFDHEDPDDDMLL